MNGLLKQRFEDAQSKEESSLMEEAFSEYLKILEEATLSDAFILSHLGTKFRRLDQSQVFVDKINQFDFGEVKKKKFVNDSYLYCLYKTDIQGYEYSEDTFDKFISSAERIVDNCEQKPAEQFNFNPYVLTVYKVVQVLKHRATTSYYQELKWINKLNPELLPVEPKEIQAQNGKKYEMASYKEFYYQVKTRCLEKTEKFEECVEYCDKALTLFDKLHYRNGLWFTARKLYCQCMITGRQQDIDNYKEIAEQNKFWYMYHKLSNIYFSNGELQAAIYYSSKALVSDEFDPEKMINLLYDIGLISENINQIHASKLFYEAVLYYRNLAGWHIPEDLRFAEKELNLSREKEPNVDKLRNFAIEIIKKRDNLIFGKVSKINKEKKFGFICYDKNKSMYFSLRSIKVPISLGDRVLFNIGIVNDKQCAMDVYKFGGNNGKDFN